MESVGEDNPDEEMPHTVLDDVAYLPPVAKAHAEFRRDLATQLVAAGSPVLVQSLPGNGLEISGVAETYDVLNAVATGELAKLDSVTRGSAVIWPLVAGYTDRPEVWDEGLDRLSQAGVVVVQGVTADLSPQEKRRLVEVAGDRGFDHLFHGSLPSERNFSAAVKRAGMVPFLDRPLPVAPIRLSVNRQLAGILASIGELWLRLGKAESRGQAFYRAARWVDREKYDLKTLASEDNLGVVSWLDDDSRQVIQESALQGESRLLAELKNEYLQA